jgi:sialic acid synthase SpsE
MCGVYGVPFLASVFDEEKIDWCENLGVQAYKIASRTVVREPQLCETIVSLGKPTFISLGFWREEGLPFADRANVRHFNCISKYPTTCFDYEDLRPYQGSVVGLSDHSYGVGYCLYNIALGAGYIEKHFTLNKTMRGNDHIGSMDWEELRALRYAGDQIFGVRRALAR